MIDWDTNAVLAGFTAAGSIGGALAGVKIMLVGVREQVERTRQDLAEHVRDDHEVQSQILDRLARIETKQDLLLEDRRHDSGSAS